MRIEAYLYFLLALSVFSILGCDNSSSHDPKGYQNVKWGASINDVKGQYPYIEQKGKESGLISQEYEEDVEDDNYLRKRNFIFYQDKLICVSVNMVRTAKTDDVLYSLVERYGEKYEKRLEGRDNHFEVITWSFPATKISYVREIKNNRKVLDGISHFVNYYDQQTVKLIDEMKEKVEESSLEKKKFELKKLPL